ncbi:MAG: L-serine ammonia-lyase, iron-sulfur-dependent, subunit alpha [Planctomycetes bacterium]|nr:L-serine ammonia-lyase, iron-sulfur-dependent, subunit alpha [Planctomycetota bacterium]
MNAVSILNHVIGPVMRGPSSSHTAGAFHIGAMARSLAGGAPAAAVIAFDTDGSYAKCYRPQGADLAFAAGLMGWSITDERFPEALKAAAASGLRLEFLVQKLKDANHPNAVDIQVSSSDGRKVHARAHSIGGGAIEFVRLAGWPVHFAGDAYETAVEAEGGAEARVLDLLSSGGALMGEPGRQSRAGRSLICARRRARLPQDVCNRLRAISGVSQVWAAEPVFFVQSGSPMFAGAREMVLLARERGLSLGRLALEYEAALLGLPADEVLAEIARRLDIMRQAVERGLAASPPPMQLLGPSAGRIYEADAAGRLAVGGLHTRAAARALAVMHVNGGMGVVCAAPTAGSAGVLPAVLVTLAEEKGLDPQGAALALLAAGAVGVVVANRATFAAEVAGCQVEIGAAGAMAAAAVVDAAGGTAEQAADAAAIAFQNTMGSVCDLVQGIVEIPCHTRNAAAASNAFLCADLVLGGYANPIPLDETVDAVYAVGKMLPSELRCTALGGLAATPSARAMNRLR